MKDRSEILSMFKYFIKKIENCFYCSIKVIRFDRALEYIQNTIQSFALPSVSYINILVLAPQKMMMHSARIIICLMLYNPS